MTPNPAPRMSLPALLALILALAWALVVNGAVPWLGIPTLGQAASMMGYAQAFANQGWLAIHSWSFGYPKPVALATGLPLAEVAAVLLHLGMTSANAYALTVALWLALALLGAIRLARQLGLRDRVVAAAAAATWLTLPMVWVHQSYSSLALGMALLPLYFSSFLSLMERTGKPGQIVYRCVEFVLLCSIALFMDGYTFMMFAVGSALLLLVTLRPGWLFAHRPRLLAMLVWGAGFVLAYMLYTAYMGRSAFLPEALEVFRGWALDITFLLRPSSGNLWFWDVTGLSLPRSSDRYFGDTSVWTTTYGLPLLICALVAFFGARKQDRRVWVFLALALFGLYMALGPTLKINAVKPAGFTEQIMPRQYGLMPTGNAYLASHVPGFRSMRAAYRWEALCLLGLWATLLVYVAHQPGRRRWLAVYVVLMGLNAPNLVDSSTDYHGFRRGLVDIDRHLGDALAQHLHPGEHVIFLPLNNDVMANYLSPRLGVVTYNVGGDKQIDIAREYWPESVKQLGFGRLSNADIPLMKDLLLRGDADRFVISYFDGLWAAHFWPCAAQAQGYSVKVRTAFASIPGFLCPAQLREIYAPEVAQLQKEPFLQVDDTPLFAVVSLKPAFAGQRKQILTNQLSEIHFPVDVAKDAAGANQMLKEGWHQPEPTNRWSGPNSEIWFVPPQSCTERTCSLFLRVSAFAASPQRPVTVMLATAPGTGCGPASRKMVVTQGDALTVQMPLAFHGHDICTVKVSVPQAVSPAALGASSDARVLGLSLTEIDLHP